MASINDITTEIRNAVIGKDVRGNIAYGIEAINTEVENTTARQSQVENRQDEVELRQTEVEERQDIIDANESGRITAEVERVTEFDTIKTDYNTYKNVMIAESNVAELQSQININASQLAESPNYPKLDVEVGVINKHYEYGNVRRYCELIDGSVNNYTDVLNAITSVINIYNSIGKLYPLFFPSGKYVIDGTITYLLTQLTYTSPLYPKLEICGEGGTIIHSNTGLVFLVSRAVVDMHDLIFTTNNVPNTLSAIQCGGKNNEMLGHAVFQSSFRRIRCYYYNAGIELGNCFDSSFYDITLWHGNGLKPSAIRFENVVRNCQLNNLNFNRVHCEYCGDDSDAIRIDNPVDNDGMVTNYHKNLVFNSLHIETRTYKNTCINIKRLINCMFNNPYLVQNYDVVSQNYDQLKPMIIFENVSNVQFNCATMRSGISTQEVATITGWKLIKLIGKCVNITVNNSEIYLPLTVRHLYDVVDTSEVDILPNTSIISFPNTYINETKYPLGHGPIVFTSDNGSTNSKFIVKKRNAGNFVSLDFGSLTGETEDITTYSKKHSANYDGSLGVYSLAGTRRITLTTGNSQIIDYYNDNPLVGFRFIIGQTASTSPMQNAIKVFALVFCDGVTVTSLGCSSQVSVGTSVTASKFNVYISSTKLRINNLLTDDMDITVLPISFGANV